MLTPELARKKVLLLARALTPIVDKAAKAIGQRKMMAPHVFTNDKMLNDLGRLEAVMGNFKAASMDCIARSGNSLSSRLTSEPTVDRCWSNNVLDFAAQRKQRYAINVIRCNAKRRGPFRSLRRTTLGNRCRERASSTTSSAVNDC